MVAAHHSVDSEPASGAPLAGIRVVDFSHVLAGPFAAMVLGDLGADVIKIERPGRGDTTRGTPPFRDGVSTFYATYNRNKRSVGIDLKDPDGLELVRALVRESDVLLHNFRPRAMESLGLGPEDALALNPALIYCGLSGYGMDSPDRDTSAFDGVIQALSGVMALTGEPGQAPGRVGLSVVDLSGGMFAAMGILAALARRNKDGQGAVVDVALFDAIFNLIGYHFTYTQSMGRPPDRSGAFHPSVVPMGRLQTQDGYVILAAFNQKFWHNVCRAVDRPEWIHDERFATMQSRAANRDVLRAELEQIVASRSTAEWSEIFKANDVPSAPVLGLDEVLQLDRIAERELLAKIDTFPSLDIGVPIRPFRLSGFDTGVWRQPPTLGQHTREVLRDVVGLDDDAITALEARGVVGPGEQKPRSST